MGLVSRWADGRIAELFLGRLRGGSYTPEENSELMRSIATILDDDQISVIAERFSDLYYADDDKQVDPEELEEALATGTDETGGTDAAADEQTEVTDAAPIAPEGTETEPAPEADEADDEAPKRPVMTYKELRAELIARFLARAGDVMTNPDAWTAAGK
jgi:hypothetical protein